MTKYKNYNFFKNRLDYAVIANYDLKEANKVKEDTFSKVNFISQKSLKKAQNSPQISHKVREQMANRNTWQKLPVIQNTGNT